METITLINETFENDKTGEQVQGITIIIDGKTKEVMDILIKNSKYRETYMEIVRDALFEGLNVLVKGSRNRR